MGQAEYENMDITRLERAIQEAGPEKAVQAVVNEYEKMLQETGEDVLGEWFEGGMLRDHTSYYWKRLKGYLEKVCAQAEKSHRHFMKEWEDYRATVDEMVSPTPDTDIHELFETLGDCWSEVSSSWSGDFLEEELDSFSPPEIAGDSSLEGRMRHYRGWSMISRGFLPYGQEFCAHVDYAIKTYASSFIYDEIKARQQTGATHEEYLESSGQILEVEGMLGFISTMKAPVWTAVRKKLEINDQK